MIVLRNCIVGVKDEREYEKIIQIAKKQGCKWNSGDPSGLHLLFVSWNIVF